MDTNKIINMYINEKYTLRHIAEIFNTNHHKIRNILIANNIKITRRNSLKEFSDEHKRKISIACKGRKAWNIGKKANKEWLIKNMVSHWKLDVKIDDLEKYEDIEKLKFLNRKITRNRKHFTTESYLKYLDKFYNDSIFNKLYNNWIEHNKNKWYMPSIDHKRSKLNGGSYDLDNLQFITWFENRAKAEMNINEWELFKKETNTSSDLFI